MRGPALLLLVGIPSLLSAQKLPFDELTARSGAAFVQAARDTLGAKALAEGTAVLSEREKFLFVVETSGEPLISIDEGPAAEMKKADGQVWFYQTVLKTGTIHRFTYWIDGKPFGGRNDIPAYTMDHYAQPGVAQGKLSDKITHLSKIYPNMSTEYWIYAAAQVNPAEPAAVMVWQDGQAYVQRDGPTRLQNVIDNLTARKQIPPIVHVFIQPGTEGERRLRSIEYDTVSDRYTRFLLDEILAEVGQKYKLRQDGYSRAIAGNSSGGICAFIAAWFKPEEFSRVLSRIGSFTSIQWQPGTLDGGNVLPFAIRKQPKRNIRLWLQDGSEDLENNHGSWPLQNLQMVNSLKMREYDFKFSWSFGTHNAAHGNAEAPEALTWLWREYDPAKTSQEYVMDPAEKAKPYYRVKALNRD
jgi:enterochelin esterase family protein